MRVDETLLIAYTDGTLPPAQFAGVASLVAGSAEAARIVRLLRASQLDYRAAFAAQPLPPLPAALARDVGRLVGDWREPGDGAGHIDGIEAADAAGGHNRSTGGDAASHVSHVSHVSHAAPPRDPPGRPRMRSLPRLPSPASLPWLLAACVAGAACAGLLLRAGPDAGLAPWVEAARGYQQLYTRDTFDGTRLDAADAAGLVATIRERDGLDLRLPDLAAAGLQLRAVQRLNFRGRPLAQLVYLPRRGTPVALCVIGEARRDAAVTALSIGATHVVTWRRAGLGYALIGARGDLDLAALGRRLAAEAEAKDRTTR
ncbi:anti-sigma factor [Burkholderia plantarii]|uniref:anti-sigma factor n=1 Tax=Burkholderia plantarii TaxID=41899 RepID=UPI0018DB2F13|nr:anti-sigma factor [Burkholderia plantarii]MBI0325734.1 anti-sigma factor [Burkholderia plantarii]